MATRLEIVTPKGRVFADDVDIVVVPGSEGRTGRSRPPTFPW